MPLIEGIIIAHRNCQVDDGSFGGRGVGLECHAKTSGGRDPHHPDRGAMGKAQ